MTQTYSPFPFYPGPQEYEIRFGSIEHLKNFHLSEVIRKKRPFIERGSGLIALTGVITLIIVGVLAHYGVIQGASQSFINQKFIPFFHNLANTHIPIPPHWSVLATSGAVLLLALSTLGLYQFVSHKKKLQSDTQYLQDLIKKGYGEYEENDTQFIKPDSPIVTFLT